MDNVVALNFGDQRKGRKTANPNPKPCDNCHRRLDGDGRESNCMCVQYRIWFKNEWNRVCAPFREMRDRISEANQCAAETN